MRTGPTDFSVLIVDDSAVFRRVLSRGLDAVRGVRVIGSVASAAEARAFLAVRRPDVIALDIEMPGEDGLSFLRDQIARDPIPTVVISALTARGVRITISALEAGAVDVVAKPAGLAPGKVIPDSGFEDIAVRLRSRQRRASGAPGPARVRPARGGPAACATDRTAPISASLRPDWVIAIGSSTGGVQALTTLLPLLPVPTARRWRSSSTCPKASPPPSRGASTRCAQCRCARLPMATR